MIKAEEARSITERNNPDVDSQMKAVERKILEAANKGEYSIIVDGKELSLEAIYKLERYGYRVEIDPFIKHEDIIQISWK